MPRRVIVLLTIAIIMTAALYWGCDDYNIVEPRFYNSDDVVSIPVREDAGILCAMVADSGGFSPLYDHRLPDMFAVSCSWCDQMGTAAVVVVRLPMGGDVRLLALNSGGGTSETLVEKRCGAGSYLVLWTPERDGVYGFSVQNWDYHKTIWFEVE